MYRPVKVKICGLTREEDIDLALELGADFIGLNIFPESPRGLTFPRAVELASRVPEGKRVLSNVVLTYAWACQGQNGYMDIHKAR